MVLFSTLWIFVTLNYIFCDVFTLFHSESLKQLMTGEMGGMEINQEFLLAFSFLMELSYGYDCLISSIILQIKSVGEHYCIFNNDYSAGLLPFLLRITHYIIYFLVSLR